MIKILLQIDWLGIVYNSVPDSNHYINFLLENQQGYQLNFERKSISAQQLSYELDTLCPFQLHMIVGQNKHKLCPFKLQFKSKLTPPITSNIQLPLSNIFDQYLKQKFFSDVEQLQVDFNFQQGKLTYKITILDAQTVSDQQQYSHLKSLLAKTDSSISEEKARISELNTEEIGSKQSSNIVEDKFQHDKLCMTSTSAQFYKTEVIPPKIKSYRSFQSLTIEEMAQKVENQNKKKKMQYEKQSQIYQTNLWYLNLGEYHQALHHNWNIKLKLLILLLALGFLFIIFGNLADNHSKKPLEKRQSKNKNHIKKIKRQKQIIVQEKQAKRK